MINIITVPGHYFALYTKKEINDCPVLKEYDKNTELASRYIAVSDSIEPGDMKSRYKLPNDNPSGGRICGSVRMKCIIF